MKRELFRLHAEVEDGHWWFVARRRIMRELVRRVVPPSPATVVVDVGCGTGANLGALAAEYACVGIDPSPEAIEYAAARFPAVRFVCGTAPEDLGAVAAQAGMFLLMDVLEHVEDDYRLLSSLLAASRPGAHVLLTVPADPALWSVHDETYGHYRRYERARLERLWQGLPVTVRLLSHFNTILFPVVKAVRAARRLRGGSPGPADTDLGLPPRLVNAALRRVFEAESRVLRGMLEDGRRRGFRRGVSLIALLRRDAGAVPVRAKPADADAGARR